MKLTLAVLVAVAASASCLEEPTFECASNAACTNGDETGICEPVGYCSFSDPECPDGRRFGELAGPLSEQCVK